MCEKPKEGSEDATTADKKSREGSYYYDDAHGYEAFDPDADEDEAEEDDSA